jgi:hypothetical protein
VNGEVSEFVTDDSRYQTTNEPHNSPNTAIKVLPTRTGIRRLLEGENRVNARKEEF